jgi:hypothetical protein
LHPFDIKRALLAKHAQHIVLIHFPIALFIIGVLFDFLAQWKKQGLLAAGIYVCVAEPGEKGGPAKTQSVILLKRTDANAFLKGRESWREFAACAVVGGSDSTANSYGGD